MPRRGGLRAEHDGIVVCDGRTLMAELTGLVHNVLLPVYFSLTGSQLAVLPRRDGNYLPGVA